MATVKTMKDLDLDKPAEKMPVMDVEVVGSTAYPISNTLQGLNTSFEGISNIAAFMPYFVLDGS